MIEDKLNREIALGEGEGCVIFDFGCYFPYSNGKEVLEFSFSFSECMKEEKYKDCTLNHRYPNKNYYTISKKYGRKVSKLGYPCIIKLGEQKQYFLHLRIGTKEKHINLVFPVVTCLDKERPICSLSLRYDFENHCFSFTSIERAESEKIIVHNWYNFKPENVIIGEHNKMLSSPKKDDNVDNVLYYEDKLIVYPTSFKNFLI